MVRRGPNFSRFVLNCEASRDHETDWGYEDAAEANLIDTDADVPAGIDYRSEWWEIRDQGRTGACVGYATADGVLRWHYAAKGMTDKENKDDRPSPRFIWMANKETDDLTRYPTTFLEPAGTSTKLALRVAQRYGCVPERMLPMDGRLSPLKPNVFFSIAAQFRITAYYNLRDNLDNWRSWIANNGPVLTRLEVDRTWKNATSTNGKLAGYVDQTGYGGHAVCLVGYTPDHFIVRNSWGSGWGDGGFAYASNEYAEAAFTEVYAAVV